MEFDGCHNSSSPGAKKHIKMQLAYLKCVKHVLFLGPYVRDTDNSTTVGGSRVHIRSRLGLRNILLTCCPVWSVVHAAVCLIAQQFFICYKSIILIVMV